MARPRLQRSEIDHTVEPFLEALLANAAFPAARLPLLGPKGLEYDLVDVLRSIAAIDALRLGHFEHPGSE